jgi:hypothetical protein
MSNKNIFKTAIIACITLVVFMVGMHITNDYQISVKNFVVGSIATIIISMLGTLLFSTADSLVSKLPEELLVEPPAESIEYVPAKSVDELEESISVGNLVKNMTDDEFFLFLSMDRYGQTKPDKDAILNLLDIIKGDPNYESKEKIIYKKLQQIK